MRYRYDRMECRVDHGDGVIDVIYDVILQLAEFAVSLRRSVAGVKA